MEEITKFLAPQFSEKEIEELNSHLAGGGSRLSVSVSEGFFSLYKEGYSVMQICKQFPQWPKGAILLARYSNKWDERRDTILVEEMNRIRDRLVKSRMDLLDFAMNQLAVANTEAAHEAAVYLQNPKAENLPRVRPKSYRDYKEVIAIMEKALLLGQPAKDGGVGGVLVNVNAADGSTVSISSGEHSDILKQLVAKKEGV